LPYGSPLGTIITTRISREIHMHKSKNILVTALAFGLALVASAAFGADAPAASTAKAAAPAAAAPAAAPAAAAAGSVSKAQFTTGGKNREPKDNIDSLTNDQTRVYFYCVLSNLQGQEVTFRWSYNDVTQAEVKQTPSSGRYRTNSSKQLDPSKL